MCIPPNLSCRNSGFIAATENPLEIWTILAASSILIYYRLSGYRHGVNVKNNRITGCQFTISTASAILIYAILGYRQQIDVKIRTV